MTAQTSASDTDVITHEIIANALKAIADEMGVVEYRSSFSPVIREALDFDCSVFDADARLLTSAEINPALLGASPFALQSALERRGRPLGPGDAILCNHPYQGGSHTPDLMVFTGAYVEDQLVAYVGSIAHHVDVGGRFPGSESALSEEVYQEGLMFPGVLLVDAGRRVQSVYDILAANVRDPSATVGDLDAQLAACRRGEERIRELCERHGATTVIDAMTRLIESTAAAASAAFSSWPERTVSAEGFMDDAGDEHGRVRVRASMRVVDGVLEVDLTGTSPQVPWGQNVPLASLHSTVFFVARYLTGLPANAGLSQRIRVIAEEGSTVNPVFPAPIGARHMTVQRLAAVLVEAAGDLLPEKAMAGSAAASPVHYLQAIDPRTGQLTVLADYYGGGGGGRRTTPGDDAVDTYTSNCQVLPIETIEMEYPWRVDRNELVEGSGGPGRMPGGRAWRREFTLVAPHADGTTYCDQTEADNAPAGWDGGERGRPAALLLRRRGEAEWTSIPGKGHIVMAEGDSICFIGAGGGGYGTPDDVG